MSVKNLGAASLPNTPWQPAGHRTAAPVWRYTENPVMGRNPTPEIARIFNSAVAPWEDTYYIIWGTDFFGASIGMAKTKNFKTFTRIENPFIPFNRNAVLFPRKIGGMYKMMSRPSDSGHTPFGDIFVSELVGERQNWLRRGPYRDHRGLAAILPRCGHHIASAELVSVMAGKSNPLQSRRNGNEGGWPLRESKFPDSP